MFVVQKNYRVPLKECRQRIVVLAVSVMIVLGLAWGGGRYCQVACTVEVYPSAQVSLLAPPSLAPPSLALPSFMPQLPFPLSPSELTASYQASLFGPTVRQVIDDGIAGSTQSRVLAWRKLLGELAAEKYSTLSKVLAINLYFNLLPWRSDQETWGAEDYWATPTETLASNGGDCEDLAIAKYFSLRAVGVPSSKLRISYVWSGSEAKAHVVLLYFAVPEDTPMVLDNVNPNLISLARRKDLQPVYDFNEERLWLVKDKPRLVDVDVRKKLPQWDAVLKRINTDTL